MIQPDPDPERTPIRGILSLLADGHATDGEAENAFAQWRAEEDARSTWHCYQLIGDVMRSEDLAGAPAADEAFLQALRVRLADEPVVLAPAAGLDADGAAAGRPAVASAPAAGWRRRWQSPLAMAAGFVVAIGALEVARGPSRQGASPALAGAQAASSALASAAPAVPSAKVDAGQLAPYLAAHRQSTMSAAFQMPGADIRNASLVQTSP